jgi:thiamine biosynthesis lipoprotein
MDPATGYPVRNGVISASVIISWPDDADGYSSAYFLMGPDKGIPYAEKHKIAVYYVMETNGVLYSTNSRWWNK